LNGCGGSDGYLPRAEVAGKVQVRIALLSHPPSFCQGPPVKVLCRQPAPFAVLALLVTAVIAAAGCSGSIANPQPSYAELAVTYNAELETLQRLEEKRTKLIAEYERQSAPDPDEAIRALTDVLNSAGDPGRLAGVETAGDPHADLDQAIASAERTHDVTSQILDSALQTTRTEAAETAAYPEELQRQLDDLDKEIAAQKARVERARAAKDAAEAK